jgi:hypothetical protein
MALILRVDVDKPYGRCNLVMKMFSKISEDLYFPRCEKLGYLGYLNPFLDFLETQSISAHIYFRNCTIPTLQLIDRLRNHKIGFHAENTKSLDTFRHELNIFTSNFSGLDISSFTKHGSGNVKMGRHHYPNYEPQKYKIWAKEVGVAYLFGNELWRADNMATDLYYECMYWVGLDKSRKHYKQPSLEEIVEIAKVQNVVILIHPCNYVADAQIQSDFQSLVKYSKKASIRWITL